jgi:hypothetical protein
MIWRVEFTDGMRDTIAAATYADAYAIACERHPARAVYRVVGDDQGPGGHIARHHIKARQRAKRRRSQGFKRRFC